MIPISSLSRNLIQTNGIWVSQTKSDISYPAAANSEFARIEDESFWFDHRNRMIGVVVDRFLQPKSVLADVGGGNGFVSAFLNTKGYETILVEPGMNGILSARKRGVVNLINSKFEDAGFQKGALPNVGLFDVLEHVEHPKLFLTELRSTMDKNSLLLVTVPAFTSLWSQNDVHAGHFTRYTIKKLRATLSEAGFEEIYSTYFFAFLTLSIFLFRTIPYRAGIHFDNLYKKASHEHKANRLKRVLNLLLNWELNRVAKSKRIGVGSSCIMVCRPKHGTKDTL
jgi:2-polyprenyl-3-methyl-5-hydroxy-6-metoxy-1,4-benzoquinol methylase